MKRILLLLFMLLGLLAEGQVTNEYTIRKTVEGSSAYRKRVTTDAGVIADDKVEKAHRAMSILNGMNSNIKFAWFGEAGSKIRTSGINSYVTKAYSLEGTRDAVQTTELNQPNLSGNIAANEKNCLSNANGQSKFLTHDIVSFAANEAWSVSTALNWNGSNNVLVFLYGNDLSQMFLREGTNYLQMRSADGVRRTFNIGTNTFIGKATILTIVHNGSGGFDIYVNGISVGNFTDILNSGSFQFLNILKGNNFNTDRYTEGKLFAHVIRSGTLTQSQVTSEYNFFRAIYPEIETVKIGTDYWTSSNLDVVCTPQGNVIAEVKPNTNVEKIINGGFDSDSGWEKGENWTIQEGKAIRASGTSTYSNLMQGGFVIGANYKITVTIESISGSVILGAAASHSLIVNQIGTYSFYTKFVQNKFYIQATSGAVSVVIDNISIQEIGWAGSTELYDGIYAQTTGTVEQKTYAAVKAAAMWSYYNNDAALGSVYGKLYNWYAAKLLQMDIDYYNAANPSTPWGYRVPAETDFTTLQTTLGGSTVAGGKMKVAGTVYFNSPNTGATNSSGFSALGGGTRLEGGSFIEYKQVCRFWSLTSSIACLVKYNLLSITIGSTVNSRGDAIRLIKQ